MPKFVVHKINTTRTVDSATLAAVNEALRRASQKKDDEAEKRMIEEEKRAKAQHRRASAAQSDSHLELAPLIIFSPTGREIRHTMREMRAEAYTKAMAEHNRAIAKHEGASLANLVRAFSATSMRRIAASIIARLLDSPGFDEEGIRWERMGPAGNVLWIDGVPSTGYENYANVQLEFDKRQMEGTLNVAQRNSTLSIKRVSFEAWRAKADELAKVGLSLSTPGFDLQTFSQERLGAAFVISYVFLMEEMQMEVDTMQREIEGRASKSSNGGGGSLYSLEDSHAPDSSNPAAAFGWHADDHLEQDDPPGPHLARTVVCQCSAGNASMGVAGIGEINYRGVGGFVAFPSAMLHRTLKVEPKVAAPSSHERHASTIEASEVSSISGSGSMWKLTGFFSRVGAAESKPSKSPSPPSRRLSRVSLSPAAWRRAGGGTSPSFWRASTTTAGAPTATIVKSPVASPAGKRVVSVEVS